MPEPETFTEIWSFHCQKCLKTWQDIYEVRHHHNIISWRQRGVVSMPPWANAGCSTCPGVSAKVLPPTSGIPRQSRTGH